MFKFVFEGQASGFLLLAEFNLQPIFFNGAHTAPNLATGQNTLDHLKQECSFLIIFQGLSQSLGCFRDAVEQRRTILATSEPTEDPGRVGRNWFGIGTTYFFSCCGTVHAGYFGPRVFA